MLRVDRGQDRQFFLKEIEVAKETFARTMIDLELLDRVSWRVSLGKSDLIVEPLHHGAAYCRPACCRRPEENAMEILTSLEM